MYDFFTKLLSDSNEVSSKRLISLLSFVLYFFIILYSILNHQDINDVIIYSLISLIIGSSVMSLTQSISSNKNIPTKITPPVPKPLNDDKWPELKDEKMPDGI